MKRNRFLFATAVLVLLAALAAGCSESDAATDNQPTEGYLSTTQPQAASLPSLEFIDPASVEGDVEPIEGERLEPGAYSVLLGGGHVEAVQWQTDLGTDQPALMLWFDEEGAVVLSDWTSEHVGDTLPIVLDGRVVVAPQVFEPILDGAVTLSFEDAGEAAAFEDAIVLAD